MGLFDSNRSSYFPFPQYDLEQKKGVFTVATVLLLQLFSLPGTLKMAVADMDKELMFTFLTHCHLSAVTTEL